VAARDGGTWTRRPFPGSNRVMGLAVGIAGLVIDLWWILGRSVSDMGDDGLPARGGMNKVRRVHSLRLQRSKL